MNLCEILHTSRRLHGGKTAILHNSRSFTYSQFADEVEATARRLHAAGVRRGERVAVLMNNSPDYLDLYYSLPLLGAWIVPLNTRWHTREMLFTLADSGARWLIVDRRFLHEARVLQSSQPDAFTILYFDEDEAPAGAVALQRQAPDPNVTFPEPDGEDVVGLFYTSGTTGGPKGAMLTHTNLSANATQAFRPPAFADGITSYLHACPMFHLADVSVVYALPLCGASHSFLPSFDPEALMQIVQDHRIQTLLLVPTMINMIVNHPKVDQYDLSSVDRILYGASPMPAPLLRDAARRFQCGFCQGYGMTEASPLLSVLVPEEHCFEDGYLPLASAGKPTAGVEIRIVDDHDRDVPAGEIGEILARGANVMKGYWKRPEVNAEVLRGGWLHTGDLGRFDNQGFLYILDRKKDMIKSGSENVYSPEVEAVLCAHPSVLESAVIGVPDPKWGETIRAVVTLRPGFAATEPELIQWCRERLTRFKCPTSIRFAAGLPKGGSGKIQKTVLRHQFSGPGTPTNTPTTG